MTDPEKKLEAKRPVGASEATEIDAPYACLEDPDSSPGGRALRKNCVSWPTAGTQWPADTTRNFFQDRPPGDESGYELAGVWRIDFRGF
jgi:hypothetical protein